MDLIPLVEFFVPSPIVGKGRPRLCRRSGRVFTPKRTKEYEKKCKSLAQASMTLEGLEPLSGPVGVRMVVAYPTPSRRKAEQGQWCISGPSRYADLDNILKSILDAMNEVVYVDDCVVCAVKCTKRFAAAGEAPGVYVQVYEL